MNKVVNVQGKNGRRQQGTSLGIYLRYRNVKHWIDMFNDKGRTEHISQPASRSLAHRECRRWQLNDRELSEQIFVRIQKTILGHGHDFGLLREDPIACNGNLRLYKYDKGMRFGRHIDQSNETDKGTTRVTVLIYLSDCQGSSPLLFIPIRMQFCFIFMATNASNMKEIPSSEAPSVS